MNYVIYVYIPSGIPGSRHKRMSKMNLLKRLSETHFNWKRQVREETCVTILFLLKQTNRQKSDTQVALVHLGKCTNTLVKVWENIHRLVNSDFLCNLRIKWFKVKISMKSFPGMREYFGATEMSHVDCMYKFTKNYRIVILTGMHFMIGKLYHNKSCFKNKLPRWFWCAFNLRKP